MTVELIGIFIYILAQFAIGALLFRKQASEDDYFLAGRNVGFAMATFSIFATWFGAETCVGSAGEVFNSGLSGARIDPFGYTICLLLMGLLLVMRIYKQRITTLADLYRERYGKVVEQTAAIIMIPTSLFWAAAQIRAFGQIISASSELTVVAGMTAAAVVVTAYTVIGGLRADIVTDLVQGILLILGLALLAIITVVHLGGISQAVALIDSDRMLLLTPDESLWAQIDTWMIPILGSLVSQELVVRIVSSRTITIARNATLLATVMYLVIGSLPLLIGLMGPHLVDAGIDHEQFLATVARLHLPGILYIVFAGAVVSAILSTVDSALLASGALASHNILGPLFRLKEERMKTLLARVCVLGSGVIAFVMAISSEGIRDLVEAASSFGSAGLLVITLFGLFTGYGGRVAALAALVGGVGGLLLAENLLMLDAPYLFSVCSAVALYLAIGLFERKYQHQALPDLN